MHTRDLEQEQWSRQRAGAISARGQKSLLQNPNAHIYSNIKIESARLNYRPFLKAFAVISYTFNAQNSFPLSDNNSLDVSENKLHPNNKFSSFRMPHFVRFS